MEPQFLTKPHLEGIEKRMLRHAQKKEYLPEQMIIDLGHVWKLLQNERDFIRFLKKQNYKDEAIMTSRTNQALNLKVRHLQDEIQMYQDKGDLTKKEVFLKKTRELSETYRLKNENLRNQIEMLQAKIYRKKEC